VGTGNAGTVVGCELAVKTAKDAFAGLDILVNSAGIAASRSVADCDEAMWDAHVNVNLKGTFFCCRAAIPALRESKGNIVNIASDAGLMGLSEAEAFSAASAGISI
jgi:NAD(P)-dependent dehydrogenase (short-subunit alcohol dehydrogenase family)